MKSLIFRSLWLGGLALLPVSSVAFDHSLFTQVLAEHVDNGLVDYRMIKSDRNFDRYLSKLATTDPSALSSPSEQIAFWINAYNAYTLRLVADAYPVDSIHDIGTGGRIIGHLLKKTPWDIEMAEVGGQKLTLNHIEHEILRKQFTEPRIHFALVCAAVSCPPLRSEAYVAARLDEQLDDQARIFLADPTKNRFDSSKRRAELSAIFSWFKEDFGGSDGSVLAFVNPYVKPAIDAKWALRQTDYDWSLNDQKR